MTKTIARISLLVFIYKSKMSERFEGNLNLQGMYAKNALPSFGI